jgi:hypothetical protein
MLGIPRRKQGKFGHGAFWQGRPCLASLIVCQPETDVAHATLRDYGALFRTIRTDQRNCEL